MSSKKFVAFCVWNKKEERPATKEEISLNVKIFSFENGNCTVEVTSSDFSLLTE